LIAANSCCDVSCCTSAAVASGVGSQADVGPGTSYPHACLGDPNDPWGPLINIPPDPDLSCLTVPAHIHGASLNCVDHLKCDGGAGVIPVNDVDGRQTQATSPAEHSWPALLELVRQLCGAHEEVSPFVCL